MSAGYRREFAAETTLNLDAALADPDHALPHSEDLEGKHRAVAPQHERFATFIRPSGGLWSSAREMARFAAAELARGVAPGGTRVASEAAVTHRWEPQVTMAADVSYGLGWVNAKLRGLRMVMHGGGTMGFSSMVMLFPDVGLGVVVLSNGSTGHTVGRALRARLLELWYGIDEKSAEQLRHRLATKKDELAKLQSRLSEPPADWVAPWLGEHRHPELGPIRLERKDDAVWADAGEYRTRLLRYDRPDGQAVLIFADPPLAGIELEPVEPSSLRLVRGQERYLLP